MCNGAPDLVRILRPGGSLDSCNCPKHYVHWKNDSTCAQDKYLKDALE
uniref:Uncharacterized protein n=1 Tax=Rhizophora mucronata TaxID=61149 RepID=A0A2P2J6E5_RHIMU